MSSLAAVDTDSMLSDFSTSLLNTTVDDKVIKKEVGHALKNRKSTVRSDSSGNYNLSSVLSNIQDNGPAYDKAGNKKNKNSNDVSDELGVNQIEGSNQEIDIPEDTFQLSLSGASIGALFNSITRTQLLLLLTVSIAIVGLAMYKLDLYVKNSIQQTVQHVNTNYSVVDREHKTKMGDRFLKNPSKIHGTKMQPMEMLPIDIISTTLPTNEVTLITSSVSMLKSEIRSLRKELELVKNKIKSDKIKTENINQKKINAENSASIISVNKLDSTKASANITSSNMPSKNIVLKA